jgi:hypothetical protein
MTKELTAAIAAVRQCVFTGRLPSKFVAQQLSHAPGVLIFDLRLPLE